MSKAEPLPKLRASEVLNWDYLVEIAEKPEKRTRDRNQAWRGFAYAFTSTGDEDIRDKMLLECIKNGTDHQSKESSEDFLKTLADDLHSDRSLIRRFARENGVRLYSDWWLARRDPTFCNP